MRYKKRHIFKEDGKKYIHNGLIPLVTPDKPANIKIKRAPKRNESTLRALEEVRRKQREEELKEKEEEKNKELQTEKRRKEFFKMFRCVYFI